MFKKTAAALAVLGAFSAGSIAADVTFYGKIDAGFKYENVEYTSHMNETWDEEALTLDSGVQDASRFGIMGSEDLGNGYKVSFKLENGFNGDDGTLNVKNELFDREAILSLSSNWGTLSAGRFGGFTAAAGTYDIVLSRIEAFDGGHKGVMGFAATDRMDNMIAYQTPNFNGFQATAMYSFKNDSSKDTDEGHTDSDRYAALALTYDIGALQLAGSFEQVLRNDAVSLKAGIDSHHLTRPQLDDGKILTFGANYDFNMFKLYGMAQVFRGMDTALGVSPIVTKKELGSSDEFTMWLGQDGIDGTAFHIGTQFDALGGAWTAGIYYAQASANDVFVGMGTFTGWKAVDIDGDYIGAAVRYNYPLSNRTFIKTSVGYDEVSWDRNSNGANNQQKCDFEKTRYFARVSLSHSF